VEEGGAQNGCISGVFHLVGSRDRNPPPQNVGPSESIRAHNVDAALNFAHTSYFELKI